MFTKTHELCKIVFQYKILGSSNIQSRQKYPIGMGNFLNNSDICQPSPYTDSDPCCTHNGGTNQQFLPESGQKKIVPCSALSRPNGLIHKLDMLKYIDLIVIQYIYKQTSPYTILKERRQFISFEYGILINIDKVTDPFTHLWELSGNDFELLSEWIFWHDCAGCINKFLLDCQKQNPNISPIVMIYLKCM